MVGSVKEAVNEISARMPDLILLSALLAPRDEDALMAHLRSLDNASHLQTIRIPQFRTGTAKPPAKKGGLFSKKTKAPAPVGCDPMEFAEAVVGHLKEACEIRNRPPMPKSAMNVITPGAPTPYIEDQSAGSASAFDTTPFQSQYVAPEPVPYDDAAEPVAFAPEPEPLAFVPEPEPVAFVPEPEPVAFVPAPEPEPEPERIVPSRPMSRAVPKSIEIDEIDRLAQELGLNLKYVDDADAAPTPAPIDEGDVFDFGAALDRARNEASGRRTV